MPRSRRCASQHPSRPAFTRCSWPSGTDPQGVQENWKALIERPICGSGRPKPHLIVVPSPYRRIIKPLIRAVRQLADEHPDRTIAVIVPELIEPHWYQMWLHSQRATLLKIALLMRGGPRIVVANTPWYVRDEPLPTVRSDDPARMR